MPKYSQASKDKLATVDKRLQDLFNEVILIVDCTIVSGLRTLAEQQMLYAQGRTMPGDIVTNCDGIIKRSNHQAEVDGQPGRAVDAVPYPIDWNDDKRMIHFAGVVRGVAARLGIPIVWGGDWDGDFKLRDQSFHDLPHFELGD